MDHHTRHRSLHGHGHGVIEAQRGGTEQHPAALEQRRVGLPQQDAGRRHHGEGLRLAGVGHLPHHAGRAADQGGHASTGGRVALQHGQRQGQVLLPVPRHDQGQAAQDTVAVEHAADLAGAGNLGQPGMVGQMAGGRYGLRAPGAAACRGRAADDGLFTGQQVKHLAPDHRGHRGNGLQPRIALRVGRRGQHHVQANGTHLQVGGQCFDQIGQARTRPGPGADALNAGFVQIDDDDAGFGCGVRRAAPECVFEGVLELA